MIRSLVLFWGFPNQLSSVSWEVGFAGADHAALWIARRPMGADQRSSARARRRADLALAREFDILASMHVGGGTPMVPLGFERLLDDHLVDGHLTVVHDNDIAADTVRR